jgi:hypothetical protein
MSVRYSDLNIEKNSSTKEIEINGQKVLVKKYLGVDKKAAIVNLSIQGATIDGCIHELLMDAYFHAMLVENYTDIEFDPDESGDILLTFDELESTGVLGQIIDSIEVEEYNSLYDALQTMKDSINQYNRSYASAFKILDELKTPGQI